MSGSDNPGKHVGQLILKANLKVEWKHAPGTAYVKLPSSSPKQSFIDVMGTPLHKLDSVDMEICAGPQRTPGQWEDDVQGRE